MSPCPPEDQLRRLLAKDLSQAERSPLEAHVQQCPRCQQSLERLTDDSVMGSSPMDLSTRTPPLDPRGQPDGPATRAIPAPSAAGAAFAFLGPGQRPDSLGRLGHYEVLEVLGRGGFGIVFRAFDEKLHRVVALKVLSPETAASPAARQRFLREARAGARVQHPNVVQTFAVEEQPLPYLVMEFIPGETLQRRIDRTGPLDAAEVVVIGRQVAEGLAAAHAVGLIHRDVKPGNILLEAGPRPLAKITDFGLARAADDASVTQSGVVVGTPLFMSPEQAAGEQLDHRSDLFSLGSVLYTIAAGVPPFRAGNSLAVLKRVAEEEPRPIPETVPHAPPWLCAVIARLMAKDPGQRIQTAAEVIRALEAGASRPPPAASRPRRLPWVAAAAVVLAAAAVGVGLWAPGFLGRSNAPQTAGSPKDGTPGSGEQPPTLSPLPRPVEGGFQFPGPGNLNAPAASEDGKLLAAPWGEKVWLFESPSGRRLRSLSAAGGRVRAVAISSRGRLLAAISGVPEPLRLRVWDLDTFGEIFTQGWGPSFASGAPTFSPDGTQLVTCPDQQGESYRVLKARTGEVIRSLPGGKRGRARFNPEGTLLATCDNEWVLVWDTQTWKQVQARKPPTGYARDLHFSPDGALLAVAASERLDLWPVPTFDRAGGFDLHCFWWFAFSPDGKSILAASTDDARTTHTLTRWDVRTGVRQGRIDLTFSDKIYLRPAPGADGRVLYVPDESSHRVRAYDAATGEELLPGAGP